MENVELFVKNKGIGKILKNVSLKEYTTYKVGGNAKYMVYPKDRSKLIQLLRFLREEKILYMILMCCFLIRNILVLLLNWMS